MSTQAILNSSRKRIPGFRKFQQAVYATNPGFRDILEPELDPGPVPEKPDPIATAETGGDPMDAARRQRRRKGRASTVQAGSLVPQDTGLKSLLG